MVLEFAHIFKLSKYSIAVTILKYLSKVPGCWKHLQPKHKHYALQKNQEVIADDWLLCLLKLYSKDCSNKYSAWNISKSYSFISNPLSPSKIPSTKKCKSNNKNSKEFNKVKTPLKNSLEKQQNIWFKALWKKF